MKLRHIFPAALLATAFYPVAHAEGTPSTCHHKGFFFGIQGGASNIVGTAKYNNTNGLNSGNFDSGRALGNFGIHAGYGFLANHVFLAGLLQGDFGNFEFKHKHNVGGTDYNASIRASSTFGFAALVGYELINRVIAYVRLGGQSASFKLRSSAGNGKSTQTAFEPGLGFRAMLTDRVYLGTEYSYAFYRRARISGGTIDITPKMQRFTVSFGYKFSM